MAARKGVTVEDRDLGYKRLVREIRKLDKSYTAVGWFGHGGDPSNDVAARAAVLNFGAVIRVTKKMRGFLAGALGIFLKQTTHVIRIPARPFIEKTAALHKKKLRERQEIEYNNLLAGHFTAKQVLSRLGEWYVGRTKWTMKTVRWTPNHPATIRQKGSSKPLVNTGQVINSTTHREIMK